jgi:ABC-2 type transport system permease protein
MAALTVNPVLSRELMERMRGRRATVVITLYLVILSGILYLVYQSSGGSNVDPFGPPAATQVAAIGRGIFEWLLFFMLLLVLFLVPGQTAGAIAGERERQTLIPLQVTLLRPASILLGKVGASLAFLVLLVVATLPLVSVSYLIGGVTIRQVLGSVALVLASGVALACLTAAVSTFAKRVQSATVLSYGLVLFLVVGTFMLYGAAALVDRSRGSDAANPPIELLLANPLVAVADVVGGSVNGSYSSISSPFAPLRSMLHRDESTTFQNVGGGFINGQPVRFDNQGKVVANNPGQSNKHFWMWSMLLLFTAAAASLGLASRRLRTPAENER